MPPRLPTFSALWQGICAPKSLAVAPLSTKAPLQALRKPTTSILGMDAPPNPSSQRGARAAAADPTTLASDIFGSMQRGRSSAESRQRIEQDLSNHQRENDYMREMTRRWVPGDVYAPHDLSGAEALHWRQAKYNNRRDMVDLLGLRPLDMYRNFSVISDLMTPSGNILHAGKTGLRTVNQRKMAKAIRRAIGLGLHPSVHRHPEILVKREMKLMLQNMATPGPVGGRQVPGSRPTRF
ncbi:ribosomal protein S18 [Xylariaceae sp. FL0594]|nr:ribosomal protein S18 [Xylariaceae sp. FL0594]